MRQKACQEILLILFNFKTGVPNIRLLAVLVALGNNLEVGDEIKEFYGVKEFRDELCI